ncbi:MAG: hypothetical protein ACETWB_07750 [Anaerolineae bacterium]
MLIELLARRLQQTEALGGPSAPQDLYGIWRDKFPPDMDLDQDLRTIREAWKEDIQDAHKQGDLIIDEH